jgi:DNA-directed RNA polymerase
VEWTTPLGLPVVQPYKEDTRFVVGTLLQNVTLQRDTGRGSHSSTFQLNLSRV